MRFKNNFRYVLKYVLNEKNDENIEYDKDDIFDRWIYLVLMINVYYMWIYMWFFLVVLRIS